MLVIEAVVGDAGAVPGRQRSRATGALWRFLVDAKAGSLVSAARLADGPVGPLSVAPSERLKAPSAFWGSAADGALVRVPSGVLVRK